MCTNFINESLLNVDDNIVSSDDNNTNIYIGLFSSLVFVGAVSFCGFAWSKSKNLFEKRFNNKNFNDVSKIHGNY